MLGAALLLPVLVSVLLGRLAVPLARHCAPRAAALALVATALAAALATGLALCAAATLAGAEIPAVAALGHWSARALRERDPVPPSLGALFALIAGTLLVLAFAQAGRAVRQLRHAARAARELGDGALVVLDEPRAAAYAVPGRHGRIVVTSGLLRSLDGTQRRAVLAHEESHLRHRHYVYVQLAGLAAAANPLLRPVTRATRLAIERWADEDAARVVGDRAVVVRALARTGLAMNSPVAALGMAETELAGRLRALREPAPRRRWPLAAVTAAGLLAFAVAAHYGIRAHALFEFAQAAYRH